MIRNLRCSGKSRSCSGWSARVKVAPGPRCGRSLRPGIVSGGRRVPGAGWRSCVGRGRCLARRIGRVRARRRFGGSIRCRWHCARFAVGWPPGNNKFYFSSNAELLIYLFPSSNTSEPFCVSINPLILTTRFVFKFLTKTPIS